MRVRASRLFALRLFALRLFASRLFALTCAAALVAMTAYGAQARDFEMGGDNDYNIMAPEPAPGSHHIVRNTRMRMSSHHKQSATPAEAATQAATQGTATKGTATQSAPQATAAEGAGPAIDTPEQIETFKSNRRKFASRGSSGLVLPTPLPGPTHYAPLGTPPTFRAAPQEQPPTVLPRLGRAIPNLPHGPENFQERASRCSFQSGLYHVPNGAFTSYMGSCL